MHKLAIVTPSQWLGDMARHSPLLEGRRITTIPNCLDIEVFRPQSKEAAKQALGLPLDKRIILFGAADATRVTYKGYHLLLEALHRLSRFSRDPYHLLVFGSDADQRPLPYPATFLGNLHDEPALARAYNAADVFVAPSQQDNLPSTLLEASACGVPMVGFRVGGIPEIIGHGRGGHIAAAFDSEDFARGIAWVTAPERNAALGDAARAHALATYAPAVVARQYLQLYEELVL
jgi:glycosyltransferase involved in cell wall biosynthesis